VTPSRHIRTRLAAVAVVAALCGTVHAHSDRRTALGGTSVDLGGEVRIEMVYVPAGSFEMGESRYDDERPVRRVKISTGYLLGKYEVTEGQWRAVMGAQSSESTGDDDLPVAQVSWEDCQEFVRRLNAKTGGGWRLPTEAEWEYACRAGTNGDYAGELDRMGWYDANSGETRRPVGRKQPNAWGLYDMHGNVWEWCQDWYDASYYDRSPRVDPQGPASGASRVYRGGCWYGTADNCRSAVRSGYAPSLRVDTVGLRLARDTQQRDR
jgi:formylglycine-generating enzyme required for sulfatase activity